MNACLFHKATKERVCHWIKTIKSTMASVKNCPCKQFQQQWASQSDSNKDILGHCSVSLSWVQKKFMGTNEFSWACISDVIHALDLLQCVTLLDLHSLAYTRLLSEPVQSGAGLTALTSQSNRLKWPHPCWIATHSWRWATLGNASVKVMAAWRVVSLCSVNFVQAS